MTNITKNDEHWQNLFEKYNIIDMVNTNGKFEITAIQINQFREARLMTKFDNKSNLPKLFQDNNLSILPITRGSYVIAPFETYCAFPNNINSLPIKYIDFPEYIQSLKPENITSEATAVNCTYLSGMIANFIGDQELLPTVSGRMSSNNFSFNINNLLNKQHIPIQVLNSQIEIDGGYEGIESLSLIEAKNNISDDFLIRQLYYPFRRWQNQISKSVKTIFLIYTNNIFTLYEYIFNDPNNYNSLKLNKIQRYSFDKLNIELIDIQKLISQSVIINEPHIPFPQANSFEQIINLCELLINGGMSKEDITVNYDFDKRQTDYYFNAGKYLDLLEQNDSEICLTSTGSRILQLSMRAKQLEFAKLIIKHMVFKDTLSLYLSKGTSPTKDEVIKIMQKSNLFNVKKQSTFERRSSTIISWVDWILELIKSNY